MEVPTIPSQLAPDSYDAFMYKFIEVTPTQVLYRGKPITDKNKNVLQLDAATFKCIAAGYFVDKNNAYGMTIISKSHSETFYLTPIPQLDQNTFESINLYYAKDKNNTCFAADGKVIKGTNYFPIKKFVPDQSLNLMQLSAYDQFKSDVIINDTHVYYRGKLVKNADAQTFCRVGKYWYKDKRSVYFVDAYQIREQPEFNPTSFISIGHHATDKNISLATILYNSPPESLIDFKPYKTFFESHPELTEYWYFSAKKRLKAQGNEAIVLGHGFFKMGNEIFYRNRPKDKNLTRILNTTTSNFKLLEQGYATNGKSLFLFRDELWSYYREFREIGIKNNAALEVLSEAWVYDGGNFYYKAFKKFKADRESFKVLNHIYAYDKDGLICEGVRKKDIKIDGQMEVVGGAYLKIDYTFYYMAKSRKKAKIDTSKVKMINDFIVIGADGSAFNHGKYRKYIGEFDNFQKLENGNWGDGTLEWKIGPWGLEPIT